MNSEIVINAPMQLIVCDKCRESIDFNDDDHSDDAKRCRPIRFEYGNTIYGLCYSCKVLLEKFLSTPTERLRRWAPDTVSTPERRRKVGRPKQGT